MNNTKTSLDDRKSMCFKQIDIDYCRVILMNYFAQRKERIKLNGKIQNLRDRGMDILNNVSIHRW